MTIPGDIFISWGSVTKEEAMEHDFVTEWRRTLNDDFEYDNIVIIAEEIRRKIESMLFELF